MDITYYNTYFCLRHLFLLLFTFFHRFSIKCLTDLYFFVIDNCFTPFFYNIPHILAKNSLSNKSRPHPCPANPANPPVLLLKQATFFLSLLKVLFTKLWSFLNRFALVHCVFIWFYKPLRNIAFAV